DPCPHIVGPTGDADGDGIGDACDPEPAVANPPAYWNGFYDPPDGAWTVPPGAGTLADWQVVRRPISGAIGWQQLALDGSQRHQILLAGVRQEHQVVSRIVLDQL